jgi:hypothetical protein
MQTTMNELEIKTLDFALAPLAFSPIKAVFSKTGDLVSFDVCADLSDGYHMVELTAEEFELHCDGGKLSFANGQVCAMDAASVIAALNTLPPSPAAHEAVKTQKQAEAMHIITDYQLSKTVGRKGTISDADYKAVANYWLDLADWQNGAVKPKLPECMIKRVQL